MNRQKHFLSGLILPLLLAGVLSFNAFAQDDSADGDSKIVNDFWRCASPTNGFWGLNETLSDSGIEIGAGLTAVYQVNAKGGTGTTTHSGRHTGRYDLQMSLDLHKLLGINDGSFFIHGWGGWPDTEGIDGHSVGSAWGINAMAVGNRSMDIVEAFYEGPLLGDNITLAIGKLDFTGIFDASEYADDECCQFLNAAFIDDPTIPFPEPGLGMVLNWDITDNWYLMSGVIDAQGDARESGFNTAFHGEDSFFYALETGITQGDGTWRVGLWYDPQPKANSDRGVTERDDLGFYTSCDQRLTKENDTPEDSQGAGVFVRYGYAPSQTNDLTNFWSVGLQYQGLIDGRDDDVFGVGYAQGCFSDSASATYPEDYESVVEAYYNAQVTPWLHVSPAIQYVTHPGGSSTADDAVILSLRTAMTF